MKLQIVKIGDYLKIRRQKEADGDWQYWSCWDKQWYFCDEDGSCYFNSEDADEEIIKNILKQNNVFSVVKEYIV